MRGEGKAEGLGVVVDMVVDEGADKEVTMVVSVLIADCELFLESCLLDECDQICSVQVVFQEPVSRSLLFFFT